jgi:hypothetical protein
VAADRDVHTDRLAIEFGITGAEARKMRDDVEFIRICAPQRFVLGPPVQRVKHPVCLEVT